MSFTVASSSPTTSRRTSGSRLDSGSPSSGTDGREPSATAKATCVCCPPDSQAAGLVQRNAEPSQPSQRDILVPQPVQPRTEPRHVGRGEPPVQRLLLRDERHPAGLFVGSSTPTVPSVGVSTPASTDSSVVLPAPFAPTNAATRPAGSVNPQCRNAQISRGPRGRRYRLPRSSTRPRPCQDLSGSSGSRTGAASSSHQQVRLDRFRLVDQRNPVSERPAPPPVVIARPRWPARGRRT